MRYDKDTDTDNNRDVEGMWSEQFRSSPSVRYRPAYSETLGGSRTATLGLCPVARGTAAVHGSQTSQAGAEWGGCGPGTNVEGSDGLLSGEAGGHGKVRGIRGIGIDHSQVLTQSGTGPSQYQTKAARFQNGQVMRPSNCPGLGYLQMDVKYVTPELSGLPYTCYLYAALDISTRYKVGLILPKVDEAGSLLALYHATQTLPFPVCYVQTDNGLEFQRRFHAKCEEVGLEHFYIHKSSPNENAVIERSFRTDEEEFFFWLEKAPRDHLELNAWYQRFLDTYNTIRPHMGINMLTPKKAITLYQKS